MDILCLMGLFPKEYESTILKDSIGGVQNAANKFQWGIVNGLDGIENIHFKIINSLYIGSYPKRYRKLHVPYFEFSHSGDAKDVNVGFTNLTLLKNFSRYTGVKKEVDKWATDNSGEKKAVIAYAMTSPFVEILNYIKKKYPEIACCLVVPDLPEYMNAASLENKWYKIAKKIQIAHFKKSLKTTDCFVFLTEYMREWFDWKVEYTVVEGISSKSKEDLVKVGQSVNKQKSILYAGMIEERYGVVDLVESFMKIDNEEWTLELFGNGSSLGKIEELSKIDSRIHLHGMVANELVLKEQKKAAFLINPRNDKQSFTKYSFPSKVIEYMGSGTPMIGYKLSGMPEEYLKFFIQINDETDGLKKCLERAINLSEEERNEMGMTALKFVAFEKNPVRQTRKIVEMLEECINE